MRIPLATAHADQLLSGLPDKLCRNVYVEPDETDPARQVILVETPGSLVENTYAGLIRGMAQADGHASGKLLVLQGTTVSTYDKSTDTHGSLTGSLSGSDDWDIAFTETQALILANGSLSYSSGTAVAAVTDADFATLLSDHGETAFTSVTTIGQRGIATYGSRFCFTAVLNVNSTTALNYYTAESSPDGIVAARALGTDLIILGARTIEFWAETGQSDDPFTLQRGRTLEFGCLGRAPIVKADNALFIVDDQRNVRKLDGAGAGIISPPWVTRLFKQTASAASIRGWTYTDEGHIFVGWTTPAGCAVYDVFTQQWHTRATLNSDTWRYRFLVSYGGAVYAGDDAKHLDVLSRTYATERMPNTTTAGDAIIREFSAFLPLPAFAPIPAVQLVASKGIGLATGQGSDPLAQMRLSTDGGSGFTAYRNRSLGKVGQYNKATIWRRNGSAKRRGVVFQIRKSDPVSAAYQALETVDG